MRSVRQSSTTMTGSTDDVFAAALGVVQHSKNLAILAVHTEGRLLVALDKAKMSNAKIYVVSVEQVGHQATLHLAVGTDPRTQKALLDGRANDKAAGRYVEGVRGALDGTAPAPATPVANHYVQKKDQVPWTDPDVEPDIDLGFSWTAFLTHMG